MSPNQQIPILSSLGNDLLQTTPYQRVITLLRPFVLLIAYIVVYSLSYWWITPLIVFFLFIAIVTATHDVVHSSLGLSQRATNWALFIFGGILLASGHSYKISHLQHHRVFPGPDDPEGDPARMTLWQAVFHGPIFLVLLWHWSWKRSSFQERHWLLAEAIQVGFIIVLGIVLWPITHAVLLYVLLVHVGTWVFPLLNVYLPHHNYGQTPFTQTHTLRGRFIPTLFLELTYHLEHHLYPQVPSHNLGKLAQRLEPTFQEFGVVPRRVL